MAAHASPGPAGTTIYSVADAAGVSIATVSRVLAGSQVVSQRTRDKVLAAVDRLDYTPSASARSLAVRQHEALGLVLPELDGPYFSELLMGFEEAAADLGLSVVLSLADRGRGLDATRFQRLAAGVDGLAVLGGIVDDEALRRTARQKPLLVVAGAETPGVDRLSAENVTSSTELTSHLLGTHGRTAPVFVGDPDIAPDVRQRHDGFVAALEAHDVAVPEPLRVGLRESDGVAAAELLLARHARPDAVVCANDETALAVLDRLVDAGLDVPGEVSVTGWDDIMTARYVRPGLTTVRQPVRELGALVARRLHERITGVDPAPQDALATRVVLRGSCGCPGDARRTRP
ncbi:LacI family DNA-binding transcriptional regulator [Phycicoccus sp. BSK3Z-2]|uniref:LacI family DNA-binding transcriptional regulator n=1 Tax=Phycicoccus avicenniae TaxID=2828860 RepID=A0A941D6G8_9MICO|nr:LacI family DNA-binding transcriptional regulator [Phycicoccus avicenniae]MBR7742750.1 LacI family DNA-binding transcriptional regulator [Phycicoccus avicenniae]